MRFAKIVFAVAAVFGFLVLPPLYFLADRIGREAPPAITHIEFYFGFVGLGTLWQILFVLIARDPVRYRAVIPLAILEKLAYTVPVVILYLNGEINPKLVFPALGDPVFGVLFLIAYFKLRSAPDGRSLA
jgi:hypothetical protein